MDRRTWRIVRFGVLLAAIVVGLLLSQREGEEPQQPPAPPAATSSAERASTPKAEPSDTLIRDVTIKDLDGAIAYQGDVELAKTLERIDAGKRLKFRNDGAVFENREKRLPGKAAGYYHEWVHPTPQLPGPGPQRIITGALGETYYTPDHYRTFERIR